MWGLRSSPSTVRPCRCQLENKHKKPKSTPRRAFDVDKNEDESSSDEDSHVGATDEESEHSCRNAPSWWEQKEKYLDFNDRATSAFLADKLSPENFEEAWRRRLKLKPSSKDFLNPLVEDMLRRLRFTLRVVFLVLVLVQQLRVHWAPWYIRFFRKKEVSAVKDTHRC